MFSFIATAFILNGMWVLPPSVSAPTKLLITQHRNNVAAVLFIKNPKGVATIPMRGFTKKAGCGSWLELNSKKIKITKLCGIRSTILACGKISGNKYIVKGIMVVGVFCKGKKHPYMSTEDISGVWIRKQKPKKTGKTISI
jgi:hypothetical protein